MIFYHNNFTSGTVVSYGVFWKTGALSFTSETRTMTGMFLLRRVNLIVHETYITNETTKEQNKLQLNWIRGKRFLPVTAYVISKWIFKRNQIRNADFGLMLSFALNGQIIWIFM